MTTLINLLPWLPGFSGFGSYVQRVLPGLQGVGLQLDSQGEPRLTSGDQLGAVQPGWSSSRYRRLLQRYSLLQHGVDLDAVLAQNDLGADQIQSIYSPFFDALLCYPQIPQLITCHDLTPLIEPNSRKAWFRYRFWQPRHVKAAHRLIAISHYVADQLMAFGADPDRLVVIPNGVNVQRPRVSAPLSEDLFVLARRDRNKNLTGLLNNLAVAQQCLPQWRGRVIIVGRYGRDHQHVMRRLALLPRPDQVVFVERMESDELIQSMRQSLLLVSASTEEGFDYPVLEAKAEGIPTLISDTTVHREFHRDSSMFFPVDDAGSMFTSHLKTLLKDRSAWQDYSRSGYALAQQMSVERQQRAIQEQMNQLH